MAKLDSLEGLLNRRVLFVKDIDDSLGKKEVRTELQVICPQQVGSICVPVDYQTAHSLRCAYCNFFTKEDAAYAYKRWRYRLKIKGKFVKMMYAVDNKDNRERVFGAWGAKFMIVVKNLSPEVDTEALCSYFEVYGEIFQCKVDVDQYGQHFGMIQYIDEGSVEIACKEANNTCMQGYSTILIVEPHKNRYLSQQPQPVLNSNLYDSDFPAFEPPRSSSYQLPPRTPPTQTFEVKMPVPAPVVTAKHPIVQPAPSYQPVLDSSVQPRVLDTGAGSSASHGVPILDLYLSNQRNSQQAALQAAEAASYSAATPAVVVSELSYDDGSAFTQAYPDYYTPRTGGSASKPKPREYLRGLMEAMEKLSDMLCCPITQEPFRDPVIAADGHSYERSAIEGWLRNNDTSPMTNEMLPDKRLVTNNLIKSIVDDFA